ncbi:MAG: insulinase family protein [Deltaproteobacteria bacterium]|nr:insulinase family protein [Deltaproteobacteria bacterium]
MRRAALVLVVAAIACRGATTPPAAGLDRRWADPTTVVPLDSRVRVGHLDNGLTYYVMRLPEATNRARLWLAVNAGSLEEDDDQRGLAHLVEHMAFRGTRRYPGSAIQDFVEHTGLGFGADLNATTSAEQTVYKLAVPTDQPGVTERGLDILHEWASAVEFEAAALDLERQVVLEEHRVRGDDARSRLWARQRLALGGGWRRSQRDPAGVREIIAHAPRELVTRFYRDWYRPELMAVIAVGDLDPDAVEADIRARFGDLRGPPSPRPRPEPGRPDGASPPPPISVVADPALPVYELGLADRPSRRQLRTIGDLRVDLARAIYVRAFRQRMAALADAGAAIAPVIPADRAAESTTMFVRNSLAEPDRLAAGLAAMVAETERIDAQGFDPAEIAEAAAYVAAAQRRANTERGVVDGRDEAAALAAYFGRGEAMPGPADALAVAAAAPWGHARPAPEPLLGAAPFAGRIDDTRTIADLGITEWTLSNGAKVVVKPLASGGQIGILVDGRASRVPLTDAATMAFLPRQLAAGGAGRMSGWELRARLRERSAALTVLRSGDHLVISGSADPAGLESLLEALYLQISDPRHAPAAERRWLAREREDRARDLRVTSGYAALVDEMAAIEAAGDPRLGPATEAAIAAIDVDRGIAIFRDALADPKDLVITIVGDVEPEALRPLVTRYLASLPARLAHLPEVEVAPLRPARGDARIVRTGGGDRSRVRYEAWAVAPGAPPSRPDLVLLQRLLERRLYARLRGELGGTYDVAVSFGPLSDDGRLLVVEVTCDPARADALADELRAVIAAAQRTPVSADEVAILEAQARRRHEDHLRDEPWWTTTLALAYREHADVHARIDGRDFFARITVEHLTAAAAANLVFDGSVLGILNPAK